MTPKIPITYRLPADLLRRVRQKAADDHRSLTITVELLLEDALTRAGYPAQESGPAAKPSR